MVHSTPESEYVAASDAGAEAIFLRNFLDELGFPQQGATPIFTDSTGAQAIISNPCNQARTKHIDIHYHYARQHVAAGRLDYRRVKSSENSSDVLTKPLPRAAHSYCAFMMGLDVEVSKAFDLSALPRDSRSRRRGRPPRRDQQTSPFFNYLWWRIARSSWSCGGRPLDASGVPRVRRFLTRPLSV